MRNIISFLLILNAFIAQAQSLLPTPVNIQKAYDKGTRSVTGLPGKNYWQNTADYTLHVNFSPDTRVVSGKVDIVYTNNSPDTLSMVVFKLYPNLYKKGSPRMSLIQPADIGDGVIIDQMSADNDSVDLSKIVVHGTNMILRIPKLAPGSKKLFSITYHYILNKGSHNRMGEIEPNADFVAYFFPRVAVYDDVNGWNMIPYTGGLEFYNDFCNFSVFITVPKDFVVWATGDLKNCDEVFAPSYCSRIKDAENNDAIVTIIDSTDLSKGGITAQRSPNNIWHFEAAEVTDFVFAVSDHYMWKSSSLVVDPHTNRRTRVDAAFNPKHEEYFRVIDDARQTVKSMSYDFPAWPFPYNHETVFDGLDQMEYPMMVNDNPVADHEESIELTDHEIFHTMFPFYMGINETKYGWMDEGWATLGEWLISPMIDSSLIDEYGVGAYAAIAGTEIDLPITTVSTELNEGYFTNSYPKPAMGYLYIKDLLGDTLFKKALHHYISEWHGKHPLPNDFFYCMNEGAGRNLNWFWKKWFFESGVPDLAIGKVLKKTGGYDIQVMNKGTKPLPIDLQIEFTDKSSSSIHQNIAVWEQSNKVCAIHVKSPKLIRRITLGNPHTPDINKKDNVSEIK